MFGVPILFTGSNNLTVFSADETVGDLEGKMILYYNAKVQPQILKFTLADHSELVSFETRCSTLYFVTGVRACHVCRLVKQ